MKTWAEDLEAIGASGIVLVIRGLEPSLARRTAQALYDVGIRAIEVTVDTPGALETIAALAAEMPGDTVVGAGTVLDASTAAMAVHAGARFLFAPNLNTEVIRTANRYGRLAIPGVMTPTEMVQAAEAGAPAVKLFPASVVGPDFIKQVRSPLPHIPIIPTGGINEENVAEFMKAGAFAVGVGAGLLKDDPQRGRWDALQERAARLVERVAQARGASR